MPWARSSRASASARCRGLEYALIGAVAGSIGTAGGVALAWAVTRFGFEIAWAWDPRAYVMALGGTVAMTVIAGLAASLRALAVRPLAVLRAEG